MLNHRSIVALTLTVCGLGALRVPSSARAQEFPGLGVGDIYAANMAFDAQFDQWNRHMSWELAKQIPNDQPLPFNAMTLAQANRETAAAYSAYNAAAFNNSQGTCNAIERWDVGAVQGNWYYGSQWGAQHDPNFYVLPYTSGAYHVDNGYIYSGYDPNHENLYPVYQR